MKTPRQTPRPPPGAATPEPLPEDLRQALQAAGLAAYFDGCTAAHRREYLRWIGEAKRAETRQARLRQAVQMLTARRAAETARGRTKRRTPA